MKIINRYNFQGYSCRFMNNSLAWVMRDIKCNFLRLYTERDRQLILRIECSGFNLRDKN